MPIVQIERRWFTYDPEAPKLPSQKVKKKQKKVVVDDAAEGKRFKYMMDIVNAPKIKEGPISEEEKSDDSRLVERTPLNHSVDTMCYITI